MRHPTPSMRPAPSPRRARIEHPAHEHAPDPRDGAQDGGAALLGDTVAEVLDAVGESARLRLELAQEQVLSQVRTSGLQGLGVLVAASFALIAWLCGVGALTWWLEGIAGGPTALAVVAGLHAAGAAGVVLATIAQARRSERGPR